VQLEKGTHLQTFANTDSLQLSLKMKTMRLRMVGPSILTVLLSSILFVPSTRGLLSLQRTAQLSYQTSPQRQHSSSSRRYMFNAFGGTKTTPAKPASSSSAPAVYDLVSTKHICTHTLTDQCKSVDWRMWCLWVPTYSFLSCRHSILVLLSLSSLCTYSICIRS
jgi:hypothetical protein